jgi:dipeptidyl aminopeptidase/acylaminoacyl peptidase
MRARILLFSLLIVIAFPALAADWDVETLLSLEVGDDYRISPDGKQAVWARRQLDTDGQTFTWQLMLSRLDIDEDAGPADPRQLTFHEMDSGYPRWSPDGTRIAFLSDRCDCEEADTQIWLLPMDGGEARAISEHPGGIDDFQWLPGERILYLAGEGETRRELDLAEAADEAWVVGDADHIAPRHLFLLDLESETSRRLTDDARPIFDFAASPDGRWAVALHDNDLHDDYDYRTPPAVLLWNLESGEADEALPPELRASDITWDLKGEGFYFTRPVASDMAELFVSVQMLGYFELAAREWRPVPLDWERGLSWTGFHASERGLLLDLADGVRNQLAHLERKGEDWKLRLLPRPERGLESVLTLGPDGKTLLLSRSHATSPPRRLVAELAKDRLKNERVFLDLNPQLAELPMPRSETLWWVGAEGDTVEGLLRYPLDFDPDADERYPLIVMLHGGPDDADQDRFLESWGGSPGLFAARGAFVLRPNYHGSSGYGLDWVESIKSRYYELEVVDILAGVDALLSLGHVDASRLGIQGWSNGAILAIATCLESGERFRVLDAGAGDVNWTSDFGNCDFGGGFDRAYLGGTPWELPEVYMDKSPLFRLDELRVPTLISFGEEDRSVPTEQGWQLYRALQQTGEAPVRFVLYPGEGHSLMSPVSRRRQMNEQLAWFDRWLFESPSLTNEALLTGSPLERALALGDAARFDGRFGERVDSLLVPEFLEREGLLVSRFELTRAQWAAHSGEVFLGDPDLPASGLSLPDAEAYCAWLSDRVGLDCRLPTLEEWEMLAGLADAEENTLAWWAGYEPGREDALRLAERVKLLEASRSLLRPVGSFAPAGESGLYDLGGNAAEWVRDGDEARPAGLCAATAADPFGSDPTPPGSYVGLRVVADAPSDADLR